MSKRSILLSAILLIPISIIYLNATGISYSNLLPSVQNLDGELVVKVNTLNTTNDFYLYYRIPGIEHFQVRKMEIDEKGQVYYRLSTQNLFGKDIEYYILQGGESKTNAISPIFTINNFTEDDSPAIYFQDVSPPSGSGTAKPKNPFLKMSASTSLAARLHDNSDFPGEKFIASGNMRLYRNITDAEDNSEFDFDSTFTLMNDVTTAESKVNLSSMKIRFRKGNHRVEVGDISISNTEFTTSYLSRRGMSYEMTGKTLYLGTFFTNSQQKTGFDGFGFPAGDANIFGASAGFNIGDIYSPIFKLRGLFLAGQDNQDSKTLYSAEDKFREGSMVSLSAEANVLKNHLNLKGEFAKSNFGKSADKNLLDKKKDEAWLAEAGLNIGVFTARADYKKVGTDFHSIANLFLQNDREGLNSTMGLSIKTFYLSLTYQDQKTNLSNTVLPMLRTKNLNANLTWSLGNHFRIGAEFGSNNLDYDKSTGLQAGSSDMDTLRYAGTFGYIAGNNSINLRIGKSESKTFTSQADASLGISLRVGEFLTFNPTLSYQANENLTDNSTSKIYNLYMNSELSFIPQTFTLTLSGSYSKTDNSITDDSTAIQADANLNFYMAKIFKNKLQPVLSLRGRYSESKFGSSTTDSTSLYLQFDLSF